MAEKLKIIPLGGLDEIGKNITVLEYGKDMIVVDCGVGFPEEDMYGVDLVIPDFSYLVANQKKLRGMFITHGHEDHIGSIPYCMQQVNCPIHGTAMTNGLIKLKLEEHGLANSVKLVTHKPGDIVKAGCFTVEFIHVNHSIADAVCFAIRTPVGTVVMTGDFKIDPTAKDGMTDLARLGELGNEGVLALLCDSTNVERAGYTPSENIVAESLDRQFKNCDQRIIVTTFASNMHRIQAVIATAKRYGRKVAVSGRSMENMLKVAQELGYLKVPAGLIVDLAAIKSLPKNKVVIVSTGSQGENMSALYRMAFSTHKQVEIQPGDRIIISASAIPGNEKAISRIINELYRKGAEVVYEKSEGLHVSGHACQEELKIIHGLVKPTFFIPVHGEQRHLQIHSKLAQSMGMSAKNVFIGDIGTVFEFTPKTCKVNGTVTAGKVFVDGTGVGDVGSVVLRDRKHLAQDGMIVVCVNLSSQDGSILTGPDIITRGFIYVKESEDLMDELKEVATEAVERCGRKRSRDWATIKSAIKSDLSGYLYKHTKRNPMILPVIMEI
ncbi:MAG: ribonuclease J [Firmicutes bacterium]|nr:ribonuclease J [Clostridiales bacterium]MDD6298066.1 ribonuclease J [Bacillota bacterium]MDD7342005.1 ribonuclease J [Bacillota bacterium]